MAKPTIDITHPNIAKLWDKKLNGNEKPSDYTYGSEKQVYWKCPKGHDHEWKAPVFSQCRKRKKEVSCPFCNNRKVSITNRLDLLHPDIAKEWHPSKNGNLLPTHFTYASNEEIWWKCERGPDHEWLAKIKERTRKDRPSGCPCCAGKQISFTNRLDIIFPDIATEWNRDKNSKDASCYTAYSNEKVWWKCNRINAHQWKATICSRTNLGRGCPKCAKHTSLPEIRVFTELIHVFGNVKNRIKFKGKEIDIYLSDINVGLEYDGSYYHLGKEEKDLQKVNFLEENGLKIIRIRQSPLAKISNYDVIVGDILNKYCLNLIVTKISEVAELSDKRTINEYLSKDSFANEDEFKRLCSILPNPLPEKSLKEAFPKIAKEWNYEKNSHLKPEGFSAHSGTIVWWKCSKGDDHEWQASIGSRTGKQKAGCPCCDGRKACKNNRLDIHFPEVSKQWHPTKNGNKKPSDFPSGSTEEVWWICDKGDDHEWPARIDLRTQRGAGCHCCWGRRVCKDNRLDIHFPEVAKQWHPSKNGILTPSMFTKKSEKIVWWKCEKGDDHEWEAMIYNRTAKNECCPCCSGKKTCKSNRFDLNFPLIAKEWHPKLNGKHKPSDFVFGSTKKIWWICPLNKKHVWQATIKSRTKSKKPICRKCRSQKKNY